MRKNYLRFKALVTLEILVYIVQWGNDGHLAALSGELENSTQHYSKKYYIIPAVKLLPNMYPG